MLMTMGATFVYEVLIYIIRIIMYDTTIEIFPFIEILLLEIIYNAILTIILYPILKSAGIYLWQNFTKIKGFTGYY